jgi:hypothetical protein
MANRHVRFKGGNGEGTVTVSCGIDWTGEGFYPVGSYVTLVTLQRILFAGCRGRLVTSTQMDPAQCDEHCKWSGGFLAWASI